MTADFADRPYALLKKVSSCLVTEVGGFDRVAYKVSSKPPTTNEWE
jgi:GMP synthase (glutamine-hydrolysing)